MKINPRIIRSNGYQYYKAKRYAISGFKVLSNSIIENRRLISKLNSKILEIQCTLRELSKIGKTDQAAIEGDLKYVETMLSELTSQCTNMGKDISDDQFIARR